MSYRYVIFVELEPGPGARVRHVTTDLARFSRPANVSKYLRAGQGIPLDKPIAVSVQKLDERGQMISWEGDYSKDDWLAFGEQRERRRRREEALDRYESSKRGAKG